MPQTIEGSSRTKINEKYMSSVEARKIGERLEMEGKICEDTRNRMLYANITIIAAAAKC
jgi:hypothetical protein